MRRDEGLATALIALVIGGTVALAIVSDITAPLCEAAKIKSAAPEKIEFGCLEFWLNRYQSLIGSVLTAGVAGMTLFWLAKQIVAAHRQVAAADRQAGAAAAQALRGTLGDFTLDEEDLRLAGRIFSDCNENFRRLGHGWGLNSGIEITPTIAEIIASSMAEAIVLIAAVQRRSSAVKIHHRTGQIGSCVQKISLLMAPILNTSASRSERSVQDHPASAHIIDGVSFELVHELEQAHRLTNDAISALHDEVDETWRRIRAAEAAATGF